MPKPDSARCRALVQCPCAASLPMPRSSRCGPCPTHCFFTCMPHPCACLQEGPPRCKEPNGESLPTCPVVPPPQKEALPPPLPPRLRPAAAAMRSTGDPSWAPIRESCASAPMSMVGAAPVPCLLHWEGGPVWRTRRQTLLRSSRPRVRCRGANAGCALVYRRSRRSIAGTRGIGDPPPMGPSEGAVRRARRAATVRWFRCQMGRHTQALALAAHMPTRWPLRHTVSTFNRPGAMDDKSFANTDRCVPSFRCSHHTLQAAQNCPALHLPPLTGPSPPAQMLPLVRATSRLAHCASPDPVPACGVDCSDPHHSAPHSPRFAPCPPLSCAASSAARWPNQE